MGAKQRDREEVDILIAKVREAFVGVFNDPDFLYRKCFDSCIDDYLIRELQKQGMDCPLVVGTDVDGPKFLDDVAVGVLEELQGRVFQDSFRIRAEYATHSVRYFVTVPAKSLR